MKIFISRNFWGRYDIFLEDEENYSFYGYAGNTIWEGDYASVYDNSGIKVLYIRQGKVPLLWNLNRGTYFLDFIKEKRTIEIKCVRYLDGHWTFEIDLDVYDLYLGSKGKKTLLKGGSPVAKYVGKENGILIMSDSCDNILLLIGLFITFNMGEASPDSDLTLDRFA